MRFINAIYFGEDFRFHHGTVKVTGDTITSVSDETRSEEGGPDACDCKGNYLLPGLVDIHIHGNSGADFSDGSYEGIGRMARYLAEKGITSFSPASLTVSEQALKNAFRTAARFHRKKEPGNSKLQGITMEGPFFSDRYKGAQSGSYLRDPDIELFKGLNEAAEGLIRIVCVAPELEGAGQFIRAVSNSAVVSIAHTEAEYETARRAFQTGARHVTHLFNAMPPMLHRAPGVVGAAAEDPNVTVELICDGVHVHESVIRAAFKLFGCERIVLVSDAMRACGMDDGDYTLGGLEVTKNGSRAVLKNGTLAGSVTDLFECMKKAIRFRIAEEDAIRAATYNPAAVLGIHNEVGSIRAGKKADLVLCSREYDLLETYVDGKPVRR